MQGLPYLLILASQAGDWRSGRSPPGTQTIQSRCHLVNAGFRICGLISFAVDVTRPAVHAAHFVESSCNWR